MRAAVIAIVMLLVGACGASAQVAESCRYYEDGGGRLSLAWMEGSEPRGARLIIHDDRWKSDIGYGGTEYFRCDNCAAGGVVSGVLRFGLAPFMGAEESQELASDLGLQGADRLDLALHPRIIDHGFAAMTSHIIHLWGARAVTEPQPVIFAGRNGRVRVVSVDDNGRSQYAIAVAVDEGCFSMFGVFIAKDSGKVSIDDIQSIGSDIAVEWYTPTVKAPPAVPTPRSRKYERSTVDDIGRAIYR